MVCKTLIHFLHRIYIYYLLPTVYGSISFFPPPKKKQLPKPTSSSNLFQPVPISFRVVFLPILTLDQLTNRGAVEFIHWTMYHQNMRIVKKGTCLRSWEMTGWNSMYPETPFVRRCVESGTAGSKKQGGFGGFKKMYQHMYLIMSSFLGGWTLQNKVVSNQNKGSFGFQVGISIQICPPIWVSGKVNWLFEKFHTWKLNSHQNFQHVSNAETMQT